MLVHEVSEPVMTTLLPSHVNLRRAMLESPRYIPVWD